MSYIVLYKEMIPVPQHESLLLVRTDLFLVLGNNQLRFGRGFLQKENFILKYILKN